MANYSDLAQRLEALREEISQAFDKTGADKSGAEYRAFMRGANAIQDVLVSGEQKPDKPSRIVQEVQWKAGGVTSNPLVQRVETRSDEVLEPMPLTRPERTHFVHILPEIPNLLDLVVTADTQASSSPIVLHETRAVERYEWVRSMWVPEREEYDQRTNTLTFYGYVRSYRFHVWKEWS